jgi:hypothetical protein
MAIRRRDSNLRRINGCAGMDPASQATATVMYVLTTILVGLVTGLIRSRTVMTDSGRGQGVGGGDAGCPTRSNRCEDLHR